MCFTIKIIHMIAGIHGLVKRSYIMIYILSLANYTKRYIRDSQRFLTLS